MAVMPNELRTIRAQPSRPRTPGGTVQAGLLNRMVGAVGPFRAPPKSSIPGRGEDREPITELIRKADADGPGVIGYYLDFQSDLVARFDFELQLWNPETGAFEWWTSPVVSAQVNSRLIGPQGEQQQDFIRMMAREILGVGEVGLALDSRSKRYRVLPVDPGSYHIVSKKDDGSPLRIAFPGSPGLKKPKERTPEEEQPEWFFIDADEVWRIFRPHPRYWNQPYSPLMRVMEDVRRFENASRAFHRAISSRLINAKVLSIKATPKDLGHMTADGKPGIGPGLAAQIESLRSGFKDSLLDRDEKFVESASPHIWVSELDDPLEVIDLGPVVDPAIAEAKQDALTDMARGLNIPQEALTNGIGSATRLLNEDNLREGIEEATRPLATLVASAITSSFLRPTLRRLPDDAIGTQDDRTIRPEDIRLWPNQLSVSADDPDIDDLFQAVDMGILHPGIIRKALEAENYALPLGPGLDDFDWWEIYRNSGQRSESDSVRRTSVRRASIDGPWATKPK